jgi:hypothetical protein
MKPVDDEVLRRLRKAFAGPDSSAAADGMHPPAERIWMAVHREVPQREIAEVILHTSTCASCAEAWRIAQDIARENQPQAAWRSPWVWGPAMAAAALLAFGIVSERTPRFGDGSPGEYRQGADQTVKPLVEDGASLSRDRVILRWTPGPEGSRYNLRVMTEDLLPITASWSLEKPEYQVPPAALAKLSSGARLLWQVDTVIPGEPRRTSPTFIVRLQ